MGIFQLFSWSFCFSHSSGNYDMNLQLLLWSFCFSHSSDNYGVDLSAFLMVFCFSPSGDYGGILSSVNYSESFGFSRGLPASLILPAIMVSSFVDYGESFGFSCGFSASLLPVIIELFLWSSCFSHSSSDYDS
ncbi:5344_t:CDS:2 [Cetraspora pellucida]|uniref:5344_t:CDS:1 n=1 Tax=Cetraspora pellucida TaxID=1433469 RepID=A0A9N8YWY8_9GLOM|nr:5344_t:CDS:2 [Cetraspora pellucida]